MRHELVDNLPELQRHAGETAVQGGKWWAVGWDEAADINLIRIGLAARTARVTAAGSVAPAPVAAQPIAGQ